MTEAEVIHDRWVAYLKLAASTLITGCGTPLPEVKTAAIPSTTPAPPTPAQTLNPRTTSPVVTPSRQVRLADRHTPYRAQCRVGR